MLRRLRPRTLALVALTALGLTLASTCVKGTGLASYPDIDACVPSCEVAVAGIPFAFLAAVAWLWSTRSPRRDSAATGRDGDG